MKYFILLILLTGCTLKEEYQENDLKFGEEYGLRLDNSDPFEEPFCNVIVDSIACGYVRYLVKSNGSKMSCSIESFKRIFTPLIFTCKQP